MSRRSPKSKNRPHANATGGSSQSQNRSHPRGAHAGSEKASRPGGNSRNHSRKNRPGGPQRSPSSGDRDQNQSVRSKFIVGKKQIEATHESLQRWLSKPAAAATSPSSATPTIQLDPWQKQATDALAQGKNVIVDAPTTAGKTRVVEHFLQLHINDRGFRACYTCPVKSLSNDKVREFRDMFGADKVGISTGDIKESLGAPLVVATLESYRNSLIGVEPDLDRTLVIFDEYHFLNDISRGSAWEEAIVLSPKTCQLILLSASVANAHHFHQWLTKIKSRLCEIISVKHRPVPLENLVYIDDHWLLASVIPGQQLWQNRHQVPQPIAIKDMVMPISQLQHLGLTPTIVYAAQRLVCQDIAFALMKGMAPLPQEERFKLKHSFDELMERFNAEKFFSKELMSMICDYGIAYHHSGIPAPGRVVIEHLVKDGRLKYCVATMGLSLGINFAVRSTVITDFRRPGERGPQPYAASEILQMTGRAGRRGRDVVGFSCWLSPLYYRRMGNATRENCQSQLRQDPTTFLGLISRNLDLDAIQDLYGESFRKHTESDTDLTLITPKRVSKRLGTQQLPCYSPSAESFRFWMKQESLCKKCDYRQDCHELTRAKMQGPLSQLHFHLHKIGCLDNFEQLTEFGDIARFFPQNGGMLCAHLLSKKLLKSGEIIKAAELMATFSLARFKELRTPRGYQYPFKEAELEHLLEYYYPYELFADLYDEPFGRRQYPVIREFNPGAAAVVRMWAEGCSWEQLNQEFSGPYMSEGDLMAILFRVATYLQSLAACHISDFSKDAMTLKSILIRDPLSMNL